MMNWLIDSILKCFVGIKAERLKRDKLKLTAKQKLKKQVKKIERALR